MKLLNLLKPKNLLIYLALTSTGCSPPNIIIDEYQGYKVGIREHDNRRTLVLDKPTGGHLTAVDFNGDGRFDELTLWHVEPGDSLERYMRLDSVQTIYNRIMKQKPL